MKYIDLRITQQPVHRKPAYTRIPCSPRRNGGVFATYPLTDLRIASYVHASPPFLGTQGVRSRWETGRNESARRTRERFWSSTTSNKREGATYWANPGGNIDRLRSPEGNLAPGNSYKLESLLNVPCTRMIRVAEKRRRASTAQVLGLALVVVC